MSSSYKCCELDKVCGYSLWHGVMFVGIATVVISSVTLIISVSCLGFMATTEQYFNNKPVLAINLIFELFSTSISSYQIVISSLVIWKTLWSKSNIFLCSVWYVSHLSILTLYFFFFAATTIICFTSKHYVLAAFIIMFGVIYEGVFVFFVIIVNSYIQTLDRARYFF